MATNGHHGMPWKREMIRLQEAGAPFATADLNVSLTDWSGESLSRKRFRSGMQDVLIDLPDSTLYVAVRRFISSYGGARSVAELLRKYPWAEAVFKDEKRASAEERKRTDAFLAAHGRRSAQA